MRPVQKSKKMAAALSLIKYNINHFRLAETDVLSACVTGLPRATGTCPDTLMFDLRYRYCMSLRYLVTRAARLWESGNNGSNGGLQFLESQVIGNPVMTIKVGAPLYL